MLKLGSLIIVLIIVGGILIYFVISNFKLRDSLKKLKISKEEEFYKKLSQEKELIKKALEDKYKSSIEAYNLTGEKFKGRKNLNLNRP